MCGITAIHGPLATREAIQNATDALVHRGPDAQGLWIDTGNSLALGHRRLAVLDLSEAGNQPMHSADGRYVIVFNGEIYNFHELRTRAQAKGIRFKGHSDTEALLEHIALFGLQETLERSVGMFAFALWDKHEKRLRIARDRFGEKPLYYGFNSGSWIAGSELKALEAVTGASWTLDQRALALYLRYTFVPAPYSIYENVRKLPPAHWAELHAHGGVSLHCYWDFSEVVRKGQQQPYAGGLDEAAEELRALLDESIQLQRVADVPVGAFLSGGIDSSTIAALMKRQGGEVVTFSIAFQENGYDESKYAAAVARHLQTRHIERAVTPRDAMALVPELPRIYDEPYGDSSMLPTILVSRVAREQVTVALSGDAGDELFGGYGRYHSLARWWEQRQRVPKLESGLGAPGCAAASHAAHALGMPHLGQRFRNRATWYEDGGLEDFYQRRRSKWWHPSDLLRQTPAMDDPPPRFAAFGSGRESCYLYAMAVDTMTYLPDDILVKVDRAAMSCSLETRVPFLDHRVAEWAWRLPVELRITPTETKRVLRKVLYKEVPRELLERPKMGFGCPVGEWVRGPLRDWAEDLLSSARLKRHGLLKPKRARDFWKLHRDGVIDQGYQLWTLLMLQAWLAERESRCA